MFGPTANGECDIGIVHVGSREIGAGMWQKSRKLSGEGLGVDKSIGEWCTSHVHIIYI